MAAILKIERPDEIRTEANRRETAVNQIKHFMQSNRFHPGDRLPTVRKLSEHLGVTRDSVWRALRQMQTEEWLEVLPNKRYVASKQLHAKILRSVRVHAVFSGEGYIYFSGFRRLADALTQLCHYHNFNLKIDLLPTGAKPQKKIWKDTDVMLVDSDSSGRLLEAFDDFPVPVIGLDADYSDRYCANVVTDHGLGGRMVAEAVLKTRARKATVVYHGGSENKARIMARIDGFKNAWLEAGRSESMLSIVPIAWSNSSFEVSLLVQQFLQSHPAHGMYFVTDGRLATSFLEVLAYQGVRVPKEASLIGYDGAQMGELTYPPMTTIQQDMELIAEKAIAWIEKVRLGGPITEGVVERIPPVFVARGSH